MPKITSHQRSEIITAILLIFLLTVFVSPKGLLMPASTDMLILVLFIVLFLVYLSFVWKERAQDEREHFHKQIAGRLSFFVGSSVLSLGIIVQALKHEIDPWLVGTLGCMLLTKIIVRIYTQITQ